MQRDKNGQIIKTSLAAHAIYRILRAGLAALGPRGKAVQIELRHLLEVSTETAGITFACPTSIALYRAKTLLTKEPDTIAWIDGMAPRDRFWDIGANVGTYSLYAANRGLTVCAFEPFAANFALLCQNIVINGLPVTAFPVAVSERQDIQTLLLSGMEAGGSRHNVGQPTHDRYAFEAKSRHGIVTTSMDDLAKALNYPDHIKIDVDGLEQNIVAGGPEVLRRAKSVLIEIDTEDADEMRFITEHMEAAGLHHSHASESNYRARNFIFSRSG